MKKVTLLFFCMTLFSCASTVKTPVSNALYEILIQESDGGASIRFFEILTEPNEIAMLQNDEKLRNKINSNDTQTASFIVLNLGEKSSFGHKIKVESVVETDKNIIITLHEIAPESSAMKNQNLFTPYSILKVNSKKEIIIK